MKQFSLSILLMLLPVVAWAESVEIGGIWYKLMSSQKAAVVNNPSNPSGGSYSGAVTIPASIEYGGTPYSVTAISDQAFFACHNLTSLTIPEGVTYIGSMAFSDCSSLTSFTIPESVKDIESSAFSGCSSLTSVTIPKGVTSISSQVFQGCSSLTSVTIPEGVFDIGGFAFSGCSSLTSVTIPEGVIMLGSSVFEKCSSLTSVTIPESVMELGWDVFSYCSSLTSVNIPKYVTAIGSYTFFNCSSLTSVTIPEGVTDIYSQAFYGCSSLTSVNIPEGVTHIDYQAFANCTALKDIYCSATNVPSAVASVFEGTNIADIVLHVPALAVWSYLISAPWGEFGAIAPLTDDNVGYRMTVTATGKGSVTYDGTDVSDGSQLFFVNGTEKAVLTLTAAEGYQVESVTVNGEDATASVAEGLLTLSEPTAALTVNVTFAYAGETASLTVGPTGMATFCYADALDFTDVSGIRAYVANGFKRSSGRLLLTHVREVPSKTGLIIKGTPGTYIIPVKATDFYYLNLLKPVFEAMTVPSASDGYANYVLADGEDGLLFYRSDDATLSANHAYLQLPAAAGARQFIEWEEADEATAISSLRDGSQSSGEYYNLQGQRVAHPAKGLYIKDGKKVLIK